MEDNEPTFTFRLGVSMAGAVSALAYSAGTLDFLFEALQRWEEAKAEPEQKTLVPAHRLVIPVFSGTSGGGMAAALTMIALGARKEKAQIATGLRYAEGRPFSAMPFLERCYRAFVVRPNAGIGDGAYNKVPDPLLSTTDLDQLKKGERMPSILNSAGLRDIAAEATSLSQEEKLSAYPFLAKPLYLFLTFGNVKGIPYQIPFIDQDGQINYHSVFSHGDWMHFAFTDLGTASDSQAGAGPWAASASGNGLVRVTLANWAAESDKAGLEFYRSAALGTGAFPLALSAISFNRPSSAWAARKFPLRDIGDRPLAPGKELLPGSNVPFASIDGGTIDNEPFQLARWSLMERPGVANERDGARADRAVLLVDPFPEPDTHYQAAAIEPSDFISIALRLVNFYKTQARFKPAEVAAAMNENVFSRFLISPRRVSADGEVKSGGDAIATGLLGGFGGFFSENFRAHDYQLGRRNCQKFLRDVFALPAAHAGFYKTWPGYTEYRHDEGLAKPMNAETTIVNDIEYLTGLSGADRRKQEEAYAEFTKKYRTHTWISWHGKGEGKPFMSLTAEEQERLKKEWDAKEETCQEEKILFCPVKTRIFGSLVPLVGSAAEEVRLLSWPKVGKDVATEAAEKLIARLMAVLQKLPQAFSIGSIPSAVVKWIVSFILWKKDAKKKLAKYIEEALEKRGQLQ